MANTAPSHTHSHSTATTTINQQSGQKQHQPQTSPSLPLSPSPSPSPSPPIPSETLLSKSSTISASTADNNRSHQHPPAITSPSSKSEKSNRRSISRQRNSISTANPTKQNYPGLLGFAALARDRTTSAIASFAEPALRSRNSSNSLHRLSLASGSNNSLGSPSSTSSRSSGTTLIEVECHSSDRPVPSRRASQASTIRARSPEAAGSLAEHRHSLLETYPPSQAYENTSTNSPLPSVSLPSGNYNKMHQTSSRLLRMTDDERPFTRVSSFHTSKI